MRVGGGASRAALKPLLPPHPSAAPLLSPLQRCCGPSSALCSERAVAAVQRHVLRHSSKPILVLWNVWLWWLYVAITHFETLIIPTVLHSAIGICLIVGFTLNTNAFALWAANFEAEGREPRLSTFLREGPFSALRFFMIPFCVSSYSSMINQEDHAGTFIFLFPTASRDGSRLVSRTIPAELLLAPEHVHSSQQLGNHRAGGRWRRPPTGWCLR